MDEIANASEGLLEISKILQESIAKFKIWNTFLCNEDKNMEDQDKYSKYYND
jgi:hypothetical protein